MANRFDRTEYPKREPDRLVVGDRWTWKRPDLTADYPVASYTLTYELEQHGDGQGQITITATDDGTDHIVEVSYSTTAGYPPGRYAWDAFITRDSDSERISIGGGTVELDDNQASARHSDPRTYAQRQIDILRETLETLNATSLSIYTIQGRYSMRREMESVRRELNKWEQVRSAEINADRIRRGLKSANNFRARF